MAKYVTKVRTEDGDLQIDYNALANLPDAPTPSSIGAAQKVHTHTHSEITDFPTSLPANGGNADTLGGKQVSEFALVSDMQDLETQVNNLNETSEEIQTQLGQKSDSGHKHDDVYYTESEVNTLLDNKANTFASGVTVLSSYQYGTTLPAAGTKGRIFFKKVSS